MIEYNPKCVVQGGFVLGMWWAGTRDKLPPFTFLSALLVFWLVYVANAVLDKKFGCEHGELYE